MTLLFSNVYHCQSLFFLLCLSALLPFNILFLCTSSCVRYCVYANFRFLWCTSYIFFSLLLLLFFSFHFISKKNWQRQCYDSHVQMLHAIVANVRKKILGFESEKIESAVFFVADERVTQRKLLLMLLLFCGIYKYNANAVCEKKNWKKMKSLFFWMWSFCKRIWGILWDLFGGV